MERSVAAGVDPSPASFAAADWAAREALRRGLSLRLLCAWEQPKREILGPAAQTVARERPVRSPDYAAESVLRRASSDLAARYPRLRLTTADVEGPPVEALLDAARHCELLALGSRSLGVVSGFLVGAIALGVLARTDRPVVLVRGGELAEDDRLRDVDAVPPRGARHREVVLGLDLHHPYEQVIDFAFDAAAVRGAPLHVIHVRDSPAPGDDVRGSSDTAADARERRALSDALLPWHEKFPEIQVRQETTTGGAAERLVLAAPGAGLLVVGRWTERPVAGARLGPVAHAVLSHAPCPIAVIPHS
jgi:nucleotide-binding universal stress UspA family protein